MLLATLHVTAVDTKVTDHPSCVFTPFIINQLSDQQCLDCSLVDDAHVFGLLMSDVPFLALATRCSFLSPRRPFPCVKKASSRAVVADQRSHSPLFGPSCKAGPWESLASALIHSAQLCSRRASASSFIPAPAHREQAKPD